MKIRTIFLLALVLVLGLKAGCGGCQTKKNAPAQATESALDAYALSLKKLSGLKQGFSYSHVLSLTTIDQDKQSINVEHVQAVSDSLALHFKKKIDDQHFFELWHENDNFLVKNRLGPWRSGAENKPMYSALIDEGFNALAWTIDEFGLKAYLTEHPASDEKKTIYIIEDKALSPDAPFLAKLSSLPEFKVVKSSVKGRLEIDALSKIPLSSRFTIAIEGGQKAIKFESETVFAREQRGPLSKPQAVEDGPLLYPVNIAPRFNDLMKHEHGDEK